MRIDHCFFYSGGDGIISPNWPGSGAGPVYGVVDHCMFWNCRMVHRVFDTEDGDSLAGSSSWDRPIVPGTTNTICFEDNYFLYDEDFTWSGDAATFYGQYGGRVTIRYNTGVGLGQNYVDAHGDHPDYGVVLYEVYNNHFSWGDYGPGANGLCNARGGMYIYHDNVFTGGPLPLQLVKYWQSDVHTVTNTY
jgi:hypothetical protein